MKTQRFFVIADDGENPQLLTWTLTIEDARKYVERMAYEMPAHTLLISQMISSVVIETKLKWSDQCAPASSPQPCG